jgi:hypothetical protein
MSDTCKTCKWFKSTWISPQGFHSGNCRRRAPVRTQISENNNGMPSAQCEDGWPSVIGTDSCGEYTEDLPVKIQQLHGVILEAQDILSRYIIPDSGISDTDCVNELLELLDGPKTRAAMEGLPARPLRKSAIGENS